MKIKRTKNCPRCGGILVKNFTGFGNFKFEMKCAKCGAIVQIATTTHFEFINMILKETTTLNP
jgi:DNA-directed RNA polymerase subunit RPC12/RpoP